MKVRLYFASLVGALVAVLSVGAVAAAAQEASVGALPQAGAVGLPDGRAYEQVSPVEKNGNQAGQVEGGTGDFGFDFAAGTGEALLYFRTGASGEASSNLNFFAVARRSPTGWTTEDALPAPLGPGNILNETVDRLLPSASISALAFANGANWVSANPAGPGVEPNGAIGGGYLFTYGDHALSWLGEPSITRPYPAKEHGRFDVEFDGGSPSLGTVYFDYEGTLVPEDAPRGPQVEAGIKAPGFYEYSHGALRSAGLLPSDSPFYPNAEDPYGATPAAYPGPVRNPAVFNNQVSLYNSPDGSPAGSRAFFVSPAPGSGLTACDEAASKAGEPVSQCTPELYVRESGEKTVLVSRDAATGAPAVQGISPMATAVAGIDRETPYVYAAPDGARAFFASASKLADGAAGEEPTGAGPWTYEFNLEDDRLAYLPGVSGPIVASSRDGSSFLFAQPVPATKDQTLELWDGRVITVARLPEGPALRTSRLRNLREPSVVPAYANEDGTVFVFESDAPIPGFGEGDARGYEQVFRYVTPTAGQPAGRLSCLSCTTQAPSGNAFISHDDGEAGNPVIDTVAQADGVSPSGGRVFFDTPAALVPQDVNGVRDVYEWEAAGEGSCPASQEGGCRSLISTGTSRQESFLVANAASGADVFFATTSGLSPLDTDGAYDIYDARSPHVRGEVVAFPVAAPPERCVDGCQPTLGQPGEPSLFTSAVGPSGNRVPPPKTSTSFGAGKAKRGTSTASAKRQRELRSALTECRHRFFSRRHARKACMKRVRSRYRDRRGSGTRWRRERRGPHGRRRHRDAHRRPATKGRS